MFLSCRVKNLVVLSHEQLGDILEMDFKLSFSIL
jgi:hypothetical protein